MCAPVGGSGPCLSSSNTDASRGEVSEDAPKNARGIVANERAPKAEFPPSETKPENKDHYKTLDFAGDQQIDRGFVSHMEPGSSGEGGPQDHFGPYSFFHGNFAVAFSSMARRSPASLLGGEAVHETLLQQRRVDGIVSPTQKLISMGDAAEVGSRAELSQFFKTVQRMKTADPLYRLLLFVHGNHESFGHNGFMGAGSDFQGAPRALLGIGGSPEEYRRDFHEAEVGEGNVLDKSVTIETVYREVFGKEPDPMRLTALNRHTYTVEGESVPRTFGNTASVFRDFWKQTRNGDWNALVQITDSSDSRAEKNWIHVSASKIEDFKTASGFVPVYGIALDTVDYTEDDVKLGALQGHVSSTQVKLVRAFMDHIRFVEPDAKFIFLGHYQAARGSMETIEGDGIAKMRGSGLGKLLSDEDVIAFVAAHDHRPNYVDLSKHPAISRKTPLAGVTAASVIDAGGKLRMTYGVDEKDPKKVFFEFRFLQLDTSKLPGNSPEVCRELQALDPYLLTHDDAIASIQDPLIREMASPQLSTAKKMALSFGLDHGLANRPESLPELIVSEDVIPASIEDNSFYARAFGSAMRLSLEEAGRGLESEKFFESYLQAVTALESFSRADGLSHEDLDAIFEEMHRNLGDLQKTSKKAAFDLEKRVLPAAVRFLEDYRGWLRDYAAMKTRGASREEFMAMRRPNGFASFRTLVSFVEKAPYGSPVASLMAQITQRASKQRMSFYREKKNLDHILPEGVVEIEGERHHIRVVLGEPEGEISEGACAVRKDYAEEGRSRVAASLHPYEGSTESHTVLRLSLGNRGGAVEAGAQTHIINHWDRPRLNLRTLAGLSRGLENNYDVYGKAALSLGDPLGYFEIGPFFKGGWNLAEGRTSSFSASVGIEINFLEGALGLSANREGADRGWNGMAFVDLAALERNTPILKRTLPIVRQALE